MKKIIYCLSLIFFTSVYGFGQKDLNIRPSLQLEPTSDQTASNKALWEEIEGTYQFIVSKEDYQIVLTEKLYDLISKSRKKEVDVRVNVDQYTTLFLPSENSLESGSFSDLTPVIYSK